MLRRRTSLALANLWYQPTRTAISIGGIAFAVLLMLIQLGFLGTVATTATGVYQHMPFDLLVRSPEYLHLYESRNVPESLGPAVASVPGVIDVRMMDVSLAKWRNPWDGSLRGIAMLGIDPERPALAVDELQPLLPSLRRSDVVLIDRTTRAEYGPIEGKQFTRADVGRTAELQLREVMIGGTYPLGTGLAANGSLIISRAGFAERLPHQVGMASLILVRLAPGVRPEDAAEQVRQKLARDGRGATAQVLTRQQVLDRELQRWIWDTPIGLIFVSGVALAAVVGAMICYMVLATDVMGRLPEYATLKAMGYRNRYLAGVVMQQSWYLATAAVVLTTPVAIVVYAVTSRLAGLPIEMTVSRVVVVMLLTLAACSVAALVALRKLTRAEPASLF